jgi:hypothetical protein
MTNNEARDLANKHNAIRGNPSAESSIQMGDTLIREGKPELALRWFVQSLAYSVGIFHPDHARGIATPGATFTP